MSGGVPIQSYRAYRANIIYAPAFGKLAVYAHGTVVVDGRGIVEGVYAVLPERHHGLPCEDFGDKLLIPAFVDLHLHASQMPIQGLGHDEGADWFADYCYPAETRYADPAYADMLNKRLIHALWEQGTMSANIMCSVHLDSAKNLYAQYSKSGMAAAIGKMNSDYGAFGEALETTEASIAQTREFIDWAAGVASESGANAAPV